MKTFNNLRIKNKLLVVFVAILIIMTATSAYSVTRLTKISHMNYEMAASNVVTMMKIDDIKTNIAKLRRQTINMQLKLEHGAISEVPAIQQDGMETYNSLKVMIDDLVTFVDGQELSTDDDRKAINDVADIFYNEYTPLLITFLDEIEKNNTKAAYEALIKIPTHSQDMTDRVQAIFDGEAAIVEKTVNDITAISTRSKYITLGTAALSYIVVIIFMLTLTKYFERVFAILMNNVKKLADGDLTMSNETIDSTDEFGTLEKDVQRAVLSIQEVIGSIDTMGNKMVEGEIYYRIEPGELKGAYKDAVVVTNTAIAGLLVDFQTFLAVIGDFVHGNFESDMPKLKGQKILLNEAIDDMRTNLNNLGNEISDVAQEVIKGNLEYQVNAEMYHGRWKEILLDLNKVMEEIAGPVHEISSVLEKCADGDLSGTVDGNYSGEFRSLQVSVNSMMLSMRTYIGSIEQTLNQVAKNNLEVSIDTEFKGDFIQIKDSVNMIIDRFNLVMSELNASASNVLIGARQISESSMNFAEGSQDQMMTITRVNKQMQEMKEQIQNSNESAMKADNLSALSKENAIKGNLEMDKMLMAMDGISSSSKNISNIIKVIEDIAFQTNLLALNAAVEAARAGTHGKGFAVVAEEVRNLAGRSQNAAKETTELIKDSIEKINEGSTYAKSTSEALTVIVENINGVSDMMGTIKTATSEQKDLVEVVSENIANIAQISSRNASLSEESAATSQELNSQSELLNGMVGEFRIRS